MPEVLPSVLVLTVMAVVALWLTASRGSITADAAAVRSSVWAAAIAAAIATATQAGHFVEECPRVMDSTLLRPVCRIPAPPGRGVPKPGRGPTAIPARATLTGKADF